jgi:hypothetical protein
MKHWIIAVIISTLSVYWFIFLQLFGESWHLTQNGQLTSLGRWITLPVIIASIIFVILKSFAEKYNNDIKERGGLILQGLLQSINSIVQKKENRFITFIHENKRIKDIKVFHGITQPRKQIQSILDNIQITFSEFFGISRDNIGLSIVYSYNNKKWEWLEAMNTQHDSNLKDILSNPDSTIRTIIDKRKISIFYPDKELAIRKKEYIPGPKDRNFNNVGSVLCRDISVKYDKDEYIRAILSITTYSKYLCSPTDPDARVKIEELIMPAFESRLRLELALIYLKEKMMSKCLNC